MSDAPLLPDDMRQELYKFLMAQPLLALATAGDADGRPQVAPLFFACDEALNFYWVSAPDSRHSINLDDWEDGAATICAPTWDFGAIQGVQVEGDAMVVKDVDERRRAQALYAAKFPFVNERFLPLMEQSIFYVLRPRWLRWIDNTRRFGYQQEFSMQAPASSDEDADGSP